MHTQTSNTNFRGVISACNITPVEGAHEARTYWYRRPLRPIYFTRSKKNVKRNGQKLPKRLLNVIYMRDIKMHIGQYQCHVAARQTERRRPRKKHIDRLADRVMKEICFNAKSTQL